MKIDGRYTPYGTRKDSFEDSSLSVARNFDQQSTAYAMA